MQQLADRYKYMYYCVNQICTAVDKKDYRTVIAFNSRLQGVINKYFIDCKDNDREDFLNAISWARGRINACKDKITGQGYDELLYFQNLMNDGRRFV